MLKEITDAADKERAQTALQAALTNGLAQKGERAIGFRGGGSVNPVWSNGEGQLYYAYGEPHPGQTTRRHWNSFGYFASAGQLRIVVEINIPTETNEKHAQGFFARDPATGATLLMHSGRFGGGVKGLTQSAFYAWAGDEPTLVASETSSRIGVLVAEVGARDTLAQIGEFVRRIAAFKEDLEQGLLDRPEFAQKRRDTEALMKEFIGKKSGQRSAEFSYETYHGAVVEALICERRPLLLAGERLDKTVLIDLFVLNGNRMIELYEVKSNVDRSSLYGAIGQLITHCGKSANAVARTLVLPEGDIVPDIEKALKREAIRVRRYRLIDRGERKQVILL